MSAPRPSGKGRDSPPRLRLSTCNPRSLKATNQEARGMLMTTAERATGRQAVKANISPSSANDWARFSEALASIARAVPERTTIRQVLALSLVAAASASRRSITLKDLQQLGGETANGCPVIGQSIERTMDTFRAPRASNPEALGWVLAEEDEDDRRRKYLHLTSEGVEALNDIIEALKGARK